MSDRPEIPAPPPEAPPLSDVERVQAQIARMDELLAQGREAMAKVDQFYRDHDIVPGIGEKMLLSSAIPEAHRDVFRRLIAELDQIKTRSQEFDPSTAKQSPVHVGVRAVGNRYRI